MFLIRKSLSGVVKTAREGRAELRPEVDEKHKQMILASHDSPKEITLRISEAQIYLRDRYPNVSDQTITKVAVSISAAFVAEAWAHVGPRGYKEAYRRDKATMISVIKELLREDTAKAKQANPISR